MAKKKDIISEISNEEIELFGAHKTKDEVKADEKARKAKERAALKAEAAARRQAAKESGVKNREMVPVFIVCGIIVVLCVVLLVIQFNRADDSVAWERNEALGEGFSYVEVAPTLSEEDITYNLVEAYYTNNGHLRLRMILGNGDQYPSELSQLKVDLWNEDTAADESYSAGGVIVAEEGAVIIPAEGTTEYVCYIAPEHLSIKDDPLAYLHSEMEFSGYVLNEDDSTTD